MHLFATLHPIKLMCYYSFEYSKLLISDEYKYYVVTLRVGLSAVDDTCLYDLMKRDFKPLIIEAPSSMTDQLQFFYVS